MNRLGTKLNMTNHITAAGSYQRHLAVRPVKPASILIHWFEPGNLIDQNNSANPIMRLIVKYTIGGMPLNLRNIPRISKAARNIATPKTR